MPNDSNEPNKPRSKYADKPYDVGKGKPPRQHQFKAGNRGGGRKRGSRNKTDFDKMLDERVVAGEDRLGRPKRRRLRELVNRQLIQKAALGDLAAIRIVKEFELKQAALRRGFDAPLTPAQIAEAEAEQEQKRQLSGRLVGLLEQMAAAKRETAPRLVYRDGKFVPADPPPDEGAAGQKTEE